MIYAVGDSHAAFTFAGIREVTSHHLGPVTLKRVGYPEDTLLPDAVRALNLHAEDSLILCFGEIDCRCYVHPQAIRPRLDMDAVLASWVARYLDVAKALETRGARVGVLCVPPPTTRERSWNASFPVAGTDEERVSYVLRFNRILWSGCVQRGFFFVDIYADYADEKGMLMTSLADECVHVRDTSRVRAALSRLRLL